MNSKTVLKEFSETDPVVSELLGNNSFTTHPFVKQYFKNFTMKETTDLSTEKGMARGQTVGDAAGAGSNMQVAATTEILNTVIRGYNRYMSDTFVKKYTTESTIFKVPKTEYQELVDSATDYTVPATNKLIDYVTIDLTTPESEKGAKVTWTRSAIEDASFDLQGELLEGLGQAIAIKILKDVLATILAVTEGNQPSGATIEITAAGITWKEFLSVVGAVDTGVLQDDDTYKSYGPADYTLVSPDIYWQLLDIIQMTNVLYEGSTDPVKAGIIKLALGTTIVKLSQLPRGTIVALNSQKAVAMVTRRSLKLEPILKPEENRYGFMGTVRYGSARVFEQAIQIGQIASS
jgi:hypothetical protein